MITGAIIAIIGIIIGVTGKALSDYYQDYLKKEKETIDNLSRLNAKWELIEEERLKKVSDRDTR